MEQINHTSDANNRASDDSTDADVRLLSLAEINAVGGGTTVDEYPLPSR